jgi:lipopolysaccharide transport system permease protein
MARSDAALREVRADLARVAASERPTVIKPPGRWPGLGLEELRRFRSICVVLAKRSLMVRYRQTVIGAAWTLLQPLTMMMVFTVFFGLVTRFPTEGIPYPVFVYVGLVAYQVVAKILNEGSQSVTANADLINKIYFPRAYFPISIALASLVDLLFSVVALAILLLFYGIVPGLPVLLTPLMIGLAVIAALGLSFWLSALNAEYRDITQLLPFLSQLWMFTSPIIYPSNLIPADYLPLYWLNPLAAVVDGLRWALTGTAAPPPEAWIIGTTVAVIVLVSGYVFFRSREPRFSDVV